MIQPIIHYNADLIADLDSRFSLREPNRLALRAVVKELATQDDPSQMTLDLATGVGKTFILAALLEYAAAQGVRNLLVVLPGKTVRTKTIGNFTPGTADFIDGAEIPKTVITPDNFTAQGAALSDPNVTKLFLLNIHHLIAAEEDGKYIKPGSADARNLRTARPQESLGSSLIEYLRGADDLFMVLDESHSYSESAKTWAPALDALRPAARVGLTATPVRGDRVIFRYTLRQAIDDKFVKEPVVAMRAGGYPGDAEQGQLTDGKVLLERKASEYATYEQENPEANKINPIMLVSCTDTAHADSVSAFLRSSKVFGNDEAVLTIHSKAMTDALEDQLARVQEPASPVRAVVQVDMLNEGWNVHNVAVLVPLRALASGSLTEQLIGRGLRLPYGVTTGNPWIDSLDIIWHAKVRDILAKRGIETGREVDSSGSGMTGNEGANTDGRVPPGPGPTDTTTPPSSTGNTSSNPGDELPNSQTVLEVPGTGHDVLVDTTHGLGGGLRVIDGLADEPEPPAPVYVDVRDEAFGFDFPVAVLTEQPAYLHLADLTQQWEREVTASLGTAVTGTIRRQKISWKDESGKIQFLDADDTSVSDFPMTADQVVDHVTHQLLKQSMLMSGPHGTANRTYAPRLVRRLIEGASDQDWTVKRGAAAGQKILRAIMKEAARVAESGQPVPSIKALRLPRLRRTQLAAGEVLVNRSTVDRSSDFERGTYYTGWQRCVFNAASFDAYDTEFKIAAMLDRSPAVATWTRLYTTDGASFEYAPGRKYFPDFVAITEDGTHWIIEGKAESGRSDEVVQSKRSAAERILRHMEGLPEWEGTRWGYVICYQDDVRRAESWEDLKTFSEASAMR